MLRVMKYIQEYINGQFFTSNPSNYFIIPFGIDIDARYLCKFFLKSSKLLKNLLGIQFGTTLLVIQVIYFIQIFFELSFLCLIDYSIVQASNSMGKNGQLP